MLIGFTGHRDWLCNHRSLLRIEERYPGATWVHGGAFTGFDPQVEEVALELGKVLGETLLKIRPDYKKYLPKVAPLKRDEVIVDMVQALYACYDNRRYGGTYYTINYAKRVGVPIEYITPMTRVKVPQKT